MQKYYNKKKNWLVKPGLIKLFSTDNYYPKMDYFFLFLLHDSFKIAKTPYLGAIVQSKP